MAHTHHTIFVKQKPSRAASVLHDYLRHAARLEADRIRLRDRFRLCRAGLELERRLLPDAPRPQSRRSRGCSHISQSGATEPAHDGALGVDRRWVPGARLLICVRWPGFPATDPRTCELASLPQSRGTSWEVIGNVAFCAFEGLAFEIRWGRTRTSNQTVMSALNRIWWLE